MDSLRIPLPVELFTGASTRHYEGEATLEGFSAGVDQYRLLEPVRWAIDITNTGDGLLVSGTAETKAQTACARCLDPVIEPIIGEIEGFYLLDEGDGAPEDLDEDEYEVLPADHVIDVEPLILSALLLEAPLIPLCKPDCKGICPSCGASLNEGPCQCAPATEEEISANNPFSVLKDFDFGS